jgi:hypothetical protein
VTLSVLLPFVPLMAVSPTVEAMKYVFDTLLFLFGFIRFVAEQFWEEKADDAAVYLTYTDRADPQGCCRRTQEEGMGD